METQQTTPRSEFWAGVRAEIPIVFGVLPFGLIFGSLGVLGGMPPLIVFAMSSIVFAGSAQFIGAAMINAAAPILSIWTTTFFVNARHMLYSATMGPKSQHLSLGWRLILSYLLTDEAFVVTALHYDNDNPEDLTHKHWFWLGAGLTLWTQWQLSTAVGVFFGSQLPPSWGLDFTLALTFIGMVFVSLKGKPMWAATLSAGAVAIAANGLPYRLGLMLAALTGIVVGLALELQEERMRNA